jgi:predicted phage-related endonuclease
MGFIYHNAIVATSWEADHIFKAHLIADELGLRPTGVSGPYTNGYMSFLIPPDGSKEGWPESERYNDLRDQWAKGVADEGLYVDWVEVGYGEAPASIIRSNGD